MVVFLIVLIIVVAVVLLFGYLAVAVSTGMALHTVYFLHRNSKRSLEHIVKPGIIIKAKEIDYRWSKTDFGDYDTRWTIINPATRQKTKFDITMNVNGSIVSIDKYEIHHIKDYLREGVDLEQFIPRR